MKRKILAAMDGSEQAINAVRYISRIFPAQNTQVVLIHVREEVPEAFLDLRRDPGFRASVAPVSAWATQMKQNIKKSMTEAKAVLTDAGFPPESVDIKIQAKRVGIARDILKESHDGYNLVVAGRTGVSGIKDVMMGSVATKLVGRLPHIPVVTVGGSPDSKKILIGFDGSRGAMNAVDCIGKLMGDTDCEVTLCHVIRPMGIHLGFMKLFNPEQEADWTTANRAEVEPALSEAVTRLKNAGFSAGRISTEIVANKISRASAITHKAEEEGYGTVVVGRRGLTAVEEFIMGRVSTKILNMASKMAVWIV
ncbi:MAG: universal stress protein [Desulfobacterales bacterium]